MTSKAPLVPDVGIVALVPDAFERPWQTRHQLLTRLSRYFHVRWVEPVFGWRQQRSERRDRRHRTDSHAFGRDGAFVVDRPPVWMPALHGASWLGSLFFRTRLRRAVQALVNRGCSRVVVSIWRPAFRNALDVVPHALSLYHMDDEYTFATMQQPIDPEERALIVMADLVSAHSPELLTRKGHLNPHTFFLPNGVDYEAFARRQSEPPDLAGIPHPRIGYVGFLKPQLDWDLLRRLMTVHRQWQFVFVGPCSSHSATRATVRLLAREPNGHFVGPKRRGELPAYAQHFDVCTMPYCVNDYTKYIYPLKLHEYLATGRPVVGSRLPTLERFAEVVSLANTETEWSSAIAAALTRAAGTAERRSERQAIARVHDWNAIASRLATIIATELGDDVVATLRQSNAADSSDRSPAA
jgi:glycosyltransferase involved in cell wall biosynthesis